MLLLGVSILLISTFTTLNAQDKGHVHEDVQKAVQEAADKVKVQGGDLPHIDTDNKPDKAVAPQLPKGACCSRKTGQTKPIMLMLFFFFFFFFGGGERGKVDMDHFPQSEKVF